VTISDKPFRSPCNCSQRQRERGNVLLLILVTIVILGLLTMAVEQDSKQQSGVLTQQTSTDQINRMLTYVSTLGGALQQMATNGEDSTVLYNNLSLTQPGQAGFESGQHNFEIFHPLGGGITPMSASSPDTTAVATNYNINPNAIITGVGCNSGAGCIVTTAPNTGHIVFSATISALSYCQQTNNILNGTSLTATPPTMGAGFTTLFPSSPPVTTAVTVNSGNCASCVNVARLCVTDGSGHYGFYADLFPPQYINSSN